MNIKKAKIKTLFSNIIKREIKKIERKQISNK
jgi:hypothetical protein